MIFGPAADGYPIVNYEYAIVPDQAAHRAGGPGDEGRAGVGHRPQRRATPRRISPRSTSWPCPSAVVSISTKLIAKVAS